MNPQPATRNPELVTIHAGIPASLPASVRARIRSEGNVIHVGSFSAADRKTMRTRRPIKPSRWSEQHRTVTMSVKNGPWRNEVTPYLAGIMDAAAFPSVRDIDICKAPQTGVSEAAHNYVGYTIDRDPGPVLYTYPDELTAGENSKDRILPMIATSLRLQSYLTGTQDDTSKLRIALQHMPIYLAWARSASRLGNKPIKVAISDEIDKYIDPPRREANSLDLIDKRLITFRRMKKSKHWKISTPTWEVGHIWQAITKAAEVVFDFWIRCPFCDEQQLMTFEQIKWPREENGDHPDPKDVKSKSLAWYECPHCQAKWNDDYRDKAVRNRGEWLARPKDWLTRAKWREDPPGLELFKYLRKYLPKEIGFIIPSWISYFVSLSEPAEAFLKWIKTKAKSKLKDFRNGHESMPFTDVQVERTEDAILALRDDRPRGIVPGGGVVAGLTVEADTQDNGFWYEVRAWGWGLTQESWQVREGFVPTFDALEKVFFKDAYLDADDNPYIIQGFVIDAMGHRTKQVYEWCTQHRRVFPFKGEQKMNQPFAFTKRLYYPGTKILIPGGINLLRANVNYYKDDLSTKLQIAPGDPGAWHLHSETNRDWATQMTAEYVDEKTGLWACRPSMANHAWDVSVYGLVIADVIGIKYWKKPEPQTTSKPQVARSKFMSG